VIRGIARRARAWLLRPLLAQLAAPERGRPTSVEGQLALLHLYRLLAYTGAPLPRLDEVGFRVYSEADEDGILLYLFGLVGTTNRILVDIGAAGVVGSNTANLLINHGWNGVLVEADADRHKSLVSFYASCPDTAHRPPRCVPMRLTADNVNEVLAGQQCSGEIDLLCIDVDGIDYHLWRAIDCVSPRVVLVEYQCILGPERAATVPYDPDFSPVFDGPYGIYNGASLAAFVKLGRAKGYRLVGSHRHGYNAFFVRDDVGPGLLPEVDAASCLRKPFARWAIETYGERVKAFRWIDV